MAHYIRTVTCRHLPIRVLAGVYLFLQIGFDQSIFQTLCHSSRFKNQKTEQSLSSVQFICLRLGRHYLLLGARPDNKGLLTGFATQALLQCSGLLAAAEWP